MRCPIFCMAWTPEGRRLVTGASSGEFTLWNGLTFNFETILQVSEFDLIPIYLDSPSWKNLFLYCFPLFWLRLNKQAHDSPVRTMVWSHNESWMVTGDHAGYVKYWQSNMNNVKMFQAHKEAIRGLRYIIYHTSRYVYRATVELLLVTVFAMYVLFFNTENLNHLNLQCYRENCQLAQKYDFEARLEVVLVWVHRWRIFRPRDWIMTRKNNDSLETFRKCENSNLRFLSIPFAFIPQFNEGNPLNLFPFSFFFRETALSKSFFFFFTCCTSLICKTEEKNEKLCSRLHLWRSLSLRLNSTLGKDVLLNFLKINKQRWKIHIYAACTRVEIPILTIIKIFENPASCLFTTCPKEQIKYTKKLRILIYSRCFFPI